MEETKIPVFSVLKRGATLKNIFLNSPPPEAGKTLSPSRNNDPIFMGRHPDCHIIVDHPSISRFHLEVRPKSSLQKLSVTDRSSVHGTWVSGKKIQPNIPIELIEGDTIRLGASTRIYRLHWMPLSHAFEMEKPMPPLIEEASDFIDNDEFLQEEHLNEVWVSNIVPSAPPMMASSPGKLFSQNLEKGDQILITQEKLEQSSCFSSIVPLLESVSSSWPLKEEIGASKNLLANEMQPEREEPSPFRSDKIAKSSSLLLRRNKSISFLQIENVSKENGSEIKKGEEELKIKEQMVGDFAGGDGDENIPFVFLAEGNVKEEKEESFVSDKENMTPINSIGSKALKSNKKIERSPLSSFSLFHKEDLEIDEPKVGDLIKGNGEVIPSVFLAEGDPKEEEEEEEEMCTLDEKMTLVNSIGSKVLKSSREMNIVFLSSLNVSNKYDLEIEQQEVGMFAIEKGLEKVPSVFFGEGYLKEEDERFVSDKDNMTQVNSIGSNVLRSGNIGIETSPLSSLSTFNLEEVSSNSGKPTSEATEQFKSNKFRSRSRLIKENGDSKLSDAKNLESLFSPEIKLQRSLFKQERSPLGEKKALHVEEDMFLSDKQNWTPKGPKSLKSVKAFARDLLRADSEEDTTFASDKENLTPQSSMAIKSKNAISQNHGRKEGTLKRRKERIPFQPLFVSSPLLSSSPASHVEGLDETFSNNYANNVHNLDGKATDIKHKEELPHIPGREKNKWYIVVDAGCFLTEESRKSLQLLEGIRGTQLIIPRIVIRELDHLKRCQGILSRGTKASSVLQWIEECMMNTSWWIHVQSSLETFPVAPTPPATPRSQLCDGSSVFGATISSNFTGFSTCGSLMEIVSPTAEDHILECALLFKRIKDDGQLMLLTSSTTLRIKAMAEGLLCETPKEFRESLVNPFSKRFLWADSSPRGSTWSCLEEVGLPENFHEQFASARMHTTEGIMKGLKLILLHSSHYGMTNSIS